MRGARLIRALFGTPILALIFTAAVMALPASRPAPPLPKPFLIYYGGFPNDGSSALASSVARRFHGYPLIVFGDALAFPHFASKVMHRLPHTTFYGYTDVGHVTYAETLASLQGWRVLGMEGVLLDDVGTGLSTSTRRLQRVIDAAHEMGLAVLLNAWDPKDLLPLSLTPGGDGLLCENWVFSDGAWHGYRGPSVYGPLVTLERRGVTVFMIVTAGRAPVLAGAIAPGVIATILTEAGSYVSVSGPNYSADSNAVFPSGELKAIIDRAPTWR